MAATVTRVDRSDGAGTREQRLLELVRDLSGATVQAAEQAFHQAPPSPAEPLERVADALVRLRHSGGLRAGAYVALQPVRAVCETDLSAPRTLTAGPQWPLGTAPQPFRSRK